MTTHSSKELQQALSVCLCTLERKGWCCLAISSWVADSAGRCPTFIEHLGCCPVAQCFPRPLVESLGNRIERFLRVTR